MTYGLDLGIMGLLVEPKMSISTDQRQIIIRICIYVYMY